MARLLAQMTEPAVGLVDQDQGVRICHNVGAIETIHVPELIHIDILSGPPTSPNDSCLRNFRASARVS
jgi:hypothetical protein